MVASVTGTAQTLFDFTRTDQVGNWIECSDTVKTTGMSKAVLVIQKTQLVQRAILFTLFNPRPNKTGYAAIRCDTNFNLSDYHYITIKCRGQGINFKYKMVLRHKGLDKNAVVFGQVFTAPENEFITIKLPIADFKPYYRGQELPIEQNPLDLTSITNLGLKVDMSPYLPDNQAGVAALEIDWIKATK
ncbi:uncharacterized protein [Chelonus insularis]|uniref:uncharacterized protein isoform X2 n=1 Tax=Chelonus insularis TaxID=460826 RepID=UPI00158C089D|nr:uncharacterized protein LOC118064112 isoform X2 [Chelonus insularis]